MTDSPTDTTLTLEPEVETDDVVADAEPVSVAAERLDSPIERLE